MEIENKNFSYVNRHKTQKKKKKIWKDEQEQSTPRDMNSTLRRMYQMFTCIKAYVCTVWKMVYALQKR